MSVTPPPVKRPASGDPAAGDGVQISPTGARGAQRTGRAVWILGISLGLIIVLMMGYLAIHSQHMQTINHPAGRDLNAQDVKSFQTPEPSPRGATPAARSSANSGD